MTTFNMNQTFTPYELFGNECGKGWHSLIKPLIDMCNKKQIPISQIKEKFGTLRFYPGWYDDELDKAIVEAEAKSAVTCEQCGAPGRLRSGGWLLTLCDAHAKD